MTKPATHPPKSKQKKEARDLRADALKIARSIKIEGQTPAETKAIANGIQRGMELFLRQQSEKARDLDKRVKKVKKLENELTQPKADELVEISSIRYSSRLPWMLLVISWVFFVVAAAGKFLL